MFSKRKNKPIKGAGGYQNQIDDDEMDGSGAVQMYGGRPNGANGKHPGSSRVGAGQIQGSADRGSAFGSTSMYRSDINSDFVINNAYTVQNDLEHVDLVQRTDANGFVRRVFVIFTL